MRRVKKESKKVGGDKRAKRREGEGERKTRKRPPEEKKRKRRPERGQQAGGAHADQLRSAGGGCARAESRVAGLQGRVREQ